MLIVVPHIPPHPTQKKEEKKERKIKMSLVHSFEQISFSENRKVLRFFLKVCVQDWKMCQFQSVFCCFLCQHWGLEDKVGAGFFF